MEVDRRRPKSQEYLGLLFGRPDGFGSSDFAQNIDLFMLYRSIWVSGADSMKITVCWAEDGSNVPEEGSNVHKHSG